VVGARQLARELQWGERLTSFSRIARQAPRENAERIAEGTDRDVVPTDWAVPSALDGPPELPRDRVTLAEFPAGPSAGTLIHSIYENIDFMRPDPQELATQTRLALAQDQLDVERYADALTKGIAESLETPIAVGDATFCLSSLSPRARVNELEFMLEIERGSSLSSAALADLLERHGAPHGAPQYARRVRELRQGAIDGFLRGFIDLVLQSGERFYVVDYKSNRLGDAVLHYQEPALRAAMIDHHYYLQALLYTLALHRYLGARLAGYDYDKHIGGYAYLFLRGMSPLHPRGTGVLAERPARALIEQLSSMLQRGTGQS